MTGWEPVGGTVWKAAVPNSLFGALQPVRRGDRRRLDRLPREASPRKHLGDVYLNGQQLLRGAEPRARCRTRRCGRRCSTTGPATTDRIRDPEQTRHVWYAEVGADETTIWANFQGADPNAEARRDQRAPLRLLPHRAPRRLHHGARLRAGARRDSLGPADRRPARPDRPELGEGLDHRGQRHPRREVLGGLARQGGLDRPQLRHAAPATSPATSTSSSRCSPPARSAGTASTSARTSSAATPSTTAARTASSVTSAACSRRSRTTTSTTSRSSASSTATRSPASSCTRRIDVVIRHNRIHDCSLGTWLDWQTQGTRVSRNLFYGNNRDLFVEVSHGPYLVDHNVLASPVSLELFSQGGAFVNNLVCGTVLLAPGPGATDALPRAAQHAGRRLRRDPRRRRPLHRQRLPRRRRPPRPTGRRRASEHGVGNGTAGYDGHPASLAEYLAQVDDPSRGDHERFMGVKQPV